MVSRPQFEEQQDPLKVESIYANLETAIDFGRLALQSDDEQEIIRYRRKACDAYEEALHSLKTTVLTHIEWETINTKMEHLESVLAVSNGTSEA
jgi:hypothetical protein